MSMSLVHKEGRGYARHRKQHVQIPEGWSVRVGLDSNKFNQEGSWIVLGRKS